MGLRPVIQQTPRPTVIYLYIHSVSHSFVHSLILSGSQNLSNTGFMLDVAIWKDAKLENIPYQGMEDGRGLSSQGRNFTQENSSCMGPEGTRSPSTVDRAESRMTPLESRCRLSMW